MLIRRPGLACVATVAGVALLTSSGCSEQAAAVRVGDSVYSDTDLQDEIEAYADNDEFWEALAARSGQDPEALRDELVRGEAPGSYSQRLVTQLVNQRVRFMLAELVLADEDIEVTAGDLAAAEDRLAADPEAGGLGEAFEAFPSRVREDLIAGIAALDVLQQELGDDLRRVILDKSESVDIEVSSHYGRWDQDQLAVIPPEGPGEAPGGSGEAPEAPVPFEE